MAGRILIVDDSVTSRIVMKARLAAACYVTQLAASGREALETARAGAFDLVLLDPALPGMDGIELIRALRADPATRDLPVVVISSLDGARLAALRAGADEFLPRPVDGPLLLARIRNLLRAREAAADLRGAGFAAPAGVFVGANADAGSGVGAGPAAVPEPMPAERIAIIAGPAETGLRWRAVLAPHLGGGLQLMDREQVLAGEGAADLYLIAADLGAGGSGLQLMSDLRCRGAGRHAAIALALGGGARNAAAMALDLGADDVLPEGIAAEEAALRLRALIRRKRAVDRLRASVRQEIRLAVIDPLTGLYNRRFALPQLARIAGGAAVAGGTGGGRPCAVMVIDIDRFKAVNDRYGHAAGDAVLAEVARRLGLGLGPADLLARIGGEEFLLVLPGCGAVRAHRAAEDLRRAVGGAPARFGAGDGEDVAVTVSVGLALGGGTGEGAEALLARADRALFAAKAHGRNRVRLCRSAA